MLMYRVEDAMGYGPYMALDACPGLCGAHSNGQRPTVWNDHKRDSDTELGEALRNKEWDGYHRYAFDSLPRLLDWFEGWFKELHASGFSIACYKVTDYILGEEQDLFRSDTAELLWKKSLTEIAVAA